MNDHNWCKPYKMFYNNSNFNYYRKCYNCELVEVMCTDGWMISAHSEFFYIYKITDTPSCNELQMQKALG